MSGESFLGKKSYVVQVIFILVLIYSVSSISVLILAVGLLPYVPGMVLKPTVLVAFAVISFVMAIIASLYHLSSMRTGRRWTDKDD
ncbi:MAG: hypothetical protein LBD31_00530 [Treponema sp.]|jgi:hypothetical protein|nr:hypothetical protein [Treponema sp.]